MVGLQLETHGNPASCDPDNYYEQVATPVVVTGRSKHLIEGGEPFAALNYHGGLADFRPDRRDWVGVAPPPSGDCSWFRVNRGGWPEIVTASLGSDGKPRRPANRATGGVVLFERSPAAVQAAIREHGDQDPDRALVLKTIVEGLFDPEAKLITTEHLASVLRTNPNRADRIEPFDTASQVGPDINQDVNLPNI